MEAKTFRERVLATVLMGSLTVGLAWLYSDFGKPKPKFLPPVVLAPIPHTVGDRAQLEERRGKLLLRVETEAKPLIPSHNVIATRRAAFRLEDGVLHARNQEDLDLWQQALESFLGNPSLAASMPELDGTVDRRGKESGLYEQLSKLGVKDPRAFVLSVVETESAFDAEATSKAGAVGLMQVMPATAADYGVRRAGLTDLDTNVRVGILYLRDSLETFGRLDQALAGYNAGIQRMKEAIDKGQTLPDIRETRDYVRKVQEAYERRLDNQAAAAPITKS